VPCRICNRTALARVLAAGLLAFGALAAPTAADPVKTLRVVLTGAEMSFDPQFSADAGSDGIIDHIYESMLDYDYLVRPMKLVPRTLEAMPTVSDDGATFVFKFRRGIYFTPDPAFKGKPRELTAADQAYALRRMLDPAVRSPWLWLIDGKIVGADAVREMAIKGGKFDYDAPIAGIDVVDRYTLRIQLKSPTCASCTCSLFRTPRARRARVVSVRARFRRASGRDRTVHAGRVQAQREDRAACESRLP
jgi:ABC-type transport system substrate-binding protein